MDEYGRETFDWPPLHTLRQKPLQRRTVDNNTGHFFLGQMGTCLYRCSLPTQRGNSDRKKEKFKEE